MLADAVFRRSPALSKLLRYLVEETVAGRSDALKSYTVAVDGLGRKMEFDSASDSSARVQMVRLRKTLENHYAHHGPTDELCIYLIPGSFTVRLGKLSAAYPTLYRPLSDNNSPSLPLAAPILQQQSVEPALTGRSLAIRTLIIVAMSALAIVAAAFALQLLPFSRAKNATLSPVLEIMPVDIGGRQELDKTAQIVATTFGGDLSPFKLSRVRVVEDQNAATTFNRQENVYRLSSQLVGNETEGTTLFLTLSDAQSGTLLWSREVRLPTGQSQIFATLIPLLGEINGPMGIIATHGTIVTKGRNDAGYPCLLKYFEFVRTREKAIEERAADCFQKPVKEQHIQATMLASRALFTIERSGAQADFDAAAQTGLKYARAAVAADPNDGSANFALARLSYLRKDCVSARFYTARTIETNPYSPMFTATLASLAGLCNYPEAGKLLDLAFATQTPAFTKGRLLLILASLEQKRPEKIAEIFDSDLPQARYNRVNYYLAETLVAASDGRPDDAKRYWRLFTQTLPPGNDTPDEQLSTIVALPMMRKKLVNYLAEKGVLAR